MTDRPAQTPLFVDLGTLAAMVRDGDRIGVGGLHFSRIPLALVRAVITHGRRDLEYVTWGGGLALELLLAAGAVRRAICCFSSLDVFGLAPRFRQAVEAGALDYEDWNALAMIQGFQAAQQQLPSMPFQVPAGSQVLERSHFAPVYPDPVSGAAVAAAPALPLDVALLHAQRADTDGNVEIQGARGLDWSIVGAARSVLVTVEEVVPAGTLQQGARQGIIPRTLVAAIAHCPGGSYPTACVPYCVTDYRTLQEGLETSPPRAAEPDPERIALHGRAARLRPSEVVRGLRRRRPLDDGPPTVDEIMVACLARLYDNDSFCSAGAVSPLAIISYLLAKRTHAPRLVIATMSCGLVDIGVRPMLMALAEPVDMQTAVLHCGGDDTYHWYYQRGRVTHEVVSAAQIDRHGRTNNIEVRAADGRRIRLPGQGGMADVANMHRDFTLYLTRHSPRSLVAEVDVVSAARGLVTDDERRAAGYQPGDVRVVTNLGVFELDKESRELVLVAVHPGVTVAEVAAATGFPLRTAARVETTEPPTAAELELIRDEIDPLGIRRLEFVAGRDRSALLAELIAGEESVMRAALGGGEG